MKLYRNPVHQLVTITMISCMFILVAVKCPEIFIGTKGEAYVAGPCLRRAWRINRYKKGKIVVGYNDDLVLHAWVEKDSKVHDYRQHGGFTAKELGYTAIDYFEYGTQNIQYKGGE